MNSSAMCHILLNFMFLGCCLGRADFCIKIFYLKLKYHTKYLIFLSEKTVWSFCKYNK